MKFEDKKNISENIDFFSNSPFIILNAEWDSTVN